MCHLHNWSEMRRPTSKTAAGFVLRQPKQVFVFLVRVGFVDRDYLVAEAGRELVEPRHEIRAIVARLTSHVFNELGPVGAKR